MPKKKDKFMIGGYGKIQECSLDLEEVNSFTVDIPDRGDFVRLYEIENATGGNVFSGPLTGRMFEYENIFVVIWSCGEYVDCGIFRK